MENFVIFPHTQCVKVSWNGQSLGQDPVVEGGIGA